MQFLFYLTALAPYMLCILLVYIHNTFMHSLTTAPVTKSGDTMMELIVRKGKFDIIKYLVTECHFSVNGEQQVYLFVVSVITHSQTRGRSVHCEVGA